MTWTDFAYDAATGVLDIDLREWSGTAARLTSWDRGLVFSTRDDDGWHVDTADPNLPILSWSTWNGSALGFLESVPEDARRRALPFEWRQVTVLRLLRDVPEYASIVDDNQALAWLLADWIADGCRPTSTARPLVLGPRAALLRAVAAVDTRAALRLLARVRLRRWEAGSMGALRRLLRTPAWLADLATLPTLDLAALMLVASWPAVVRFPAVRALVADGKADRVLGVVPVLRDIDRLARHLGVEDARAAYRACDSVEDLVRLHDRWAERSSRMRSDEKVAALARSYGTDVLPEPPVEDSDTIIALRTLRQLFDEGAAMHHCVAAYHAPVMAGRAAIYKLLAPERATLELSISDGGIAAKQLKLACNDAPSEATWRAVHAWLDAHRRRSQP